jgi:ABC-type enterochelin transport system permease subunit
MKLQIKVAVISFLFFVAIYVILIAIIFLSAIEAKPLVAGIMGAITASITMFIAPRTKKIKLQSGEKIIIINDLFNLFKKEDS